MARKRFRAKARLRAARREIRQHWFYLLCQAATIVALIWWAVDARLPWTGVGVAIIAFLAALMSAHRNIRQWHKFVYFALMALLLLVEFRAMRKDRQDNAQAQRDAQQHLQDEEDSRLKTMLGEERINTQSLLEQENKSLEKVLKQDQVEFSKSLSTIVNAHREDQRDFASVTKAQYELAESFFGRLVPGDDPTPPNACSTPQNDRPRPPGAITTIYGDNADVGILPHTVMTVGNARVIGIDHVMGGSAVALALDFRDRENRVLLRIDENGTVNRSELTLLHPAKNVFLVQDKQGHDFLRATYINREAFEVTGNAIYCGRLFPIQLDDIHGSCTEGVSIAGNIPLPPCPVLPQK